ncbi:MAG: hypothetical protein K6G80_09175 [Treponema sp.]|nr:hypothetical protein [Treponema sp.]
MEKTAVKPEKIRFRRLLRLAATAAVLLAATPVAAKAPTPAQIRELVVKSAEEICFTAQECAFTLSIPGVEASKIQTELPRLPLGIQFNSSRREVYFDDTTIQSGTRLQLWFTFSETGTFTIPPLTVIISGRRYKLPFETVTVYENLSTLLPKLTVQFDEDMQDHFDKNGALHIQEGTEVIFSVTAKFCVQLVRFSWRLPKNALFKEISRTETADGAFLGKAFSNTEYPLASFSWTPLTAGTFSLPDIAMTAVAYNGMKRIVSPQNLVVIVEKSTPEAASALETQPTDAEQLFADAFTAPPKEQPAAVIEVPQVDCAKLASMRSAERHSVPFSSIRAKRQSYERQSGLSAPPEKRIPVAIFFYILLSVSIILLIILCLLKHYKRATSCGCIAVFLLSICIHWTIQLSETYAIFTGGDLRTIPEEKTVSTHTETPGLRVRILESTEDWAFIIATDASGWVPKEKLFIIR